MSGHGLVAVDCMDVSNMCAQKGNCKFILRLEALMLAFEGQKAVHYAWCHRTAPSWCRCLRSVVMRREDLWSNLAEICCHPQCMPVSILTAVPRSAISACMRSCCTKSRGRPETTVSVSRVAAASAATQGVRYPRALCGFKHARSMPNTQGHLLIIFRKQSLRSQQSEQRIVCPPPMRA